MKFDIIEKFTSINGEGLRSGQLSTFIRFKGCNLRCSYCDSAYAYDPAEPSEVMGEDEIINYCRKQGAKCVTLAGGEPLYRDGIVELIKTLCREGFSVEIETNGSLDIGEIASIQENRPYITLDYKTAISGMEAHNKTDNYEYLCKRDSVKFVVGSTHDLETARAIAEEYGLTEKANVILSPAYGEIEPAQIVDYMKRNHLNGYKMQIQIHKVIWDAERRGV